MFAEIDNMGILTIEKWTTMGIDDRPHTFV